MITLRCTKKLQKHLGVKATADDQESTSALGDWYANLVYMPKGWPLMLISNERTMLTVLLPHDADLVPVFRQHVLALYERLEFPQSVIEAEGLHLQDIRIGKTNNRRILGSMNDAALNAEVRLYEMPGGRPSLEAVEDDLTCNIYRMFDYESPVQLARYHFGLPLKPDLKDGSLYNTNVKSYAAKGRKTSESGARDDEPIPTKPNIGNVLRLVTGTPRVQRSPKTSKQRTTLALSVREYALVIRCMLLTENLIEALDNATAKDNKLHVQLTAEELDEFSEYLAAEANHCPDKHQQKRWDALQDRVQGVLDKIGRG